MFIKRAYKASVEWVRSHDEVVKPGHQGLHFQTDHKQKTCVGGFLSLCITLYVFFIAYTKGKQMLGLEEPYISSITEKFESDVVGKVNLDQLSKAVLVINDKNGYAKLREENYR